ncbi:MAG: isochorismatase family protein [Rhodospirillaceae bacterium]
MTRALIVIDVQNEYYPGGAIPLHEPDAAEARIIEGIKQAQAAGDRVILIQHVFPEGSPMFAAGTPGVGIRPGILQAAGDAPIVTKQYADSFQDTDLKTHLEGIDSLLICGMMTQNCVVFTTLSQDAAPYEVKVIGDLCAAPFEVVHQIALQALSAKRPVVTAAEIWN